MRFYEDVRALFQTRLLSTVKFLLQVTNLSFDMMNRSKSVETRDLLLVNRE